MKVPGVGVAGVFRIFTVAVTVAPVQAAVAGVIV
jgi:hypothetical protein